MIQAMSAQTYGNWKPLIQLGSGGQGIVYLAYDVLSPGLETMQSLIRADPKKDNRTIGISAEGLSALILMQAPNMIRYGALKVIRSDEKSRDSKNASARVAQEILAYQSIRHPNLVKILDIDFATNSFVLEYYPGGALSNHPELFIEDPRSALKQFRKLVDGVCRLHRTYIHRDIKPENIFIASDGRLVLGDMGIVHVLPSEETAKSRLTNEFSNVGTRAWMPPWCMNIRQEKVLPSFDVYSLGKVLWFLVTGQPRFPVAYENNSVLTYIRNQRDGQIIENIVSKCVVTNEKDCLPTAIDLLNLVDASLAEMRLPGAARSRDLEMSLYSFRNRGGYPLFSIEMPERAEDGSPVANRLVNWKIEHPAVAGTFFHSNCIGEQQKAAWGRVLGRTNPYEPLSLKLGALGPQSHDNYVEVMPSSQIPFMAGRYLHIVAKIDDEVTFSVQLIIKFKSDTYVLGFSTKIRANNQNERWQLIPGSKIDDGFRILVLDIHEAFDAASTGEGVEAEFCNLYAVRLRGAFWLTSLRLI